MIKTKAGKINKKTSGRVVSAVLCLFLIVLSQVSVFADNELYEVDPITNRIIGDVNGNGSESISTRRLTTNCTFDSSSKKYVYTVGDNASVYFTSSVFNGEYVSEIVTIDARNASNVVIYRDGTEVAASDIYNLQDAGYYMVKNGSKDETVMSFEILPSVINNLNRFDVPSMYYIVSASVDGQKISAGNLSYIRLEKEGSYIIKYNSSSLGISRTVSFTIDRTAPVLEIAGLKDGYANGPVTIGERESESTLTVLLNGEEISVKDKYTQHGNYHMLYTDKAGNVSSYDFTIKMYLDINAGLVLALFGAIILGVGAYMIYLRKHMRTC